MSTFNPTEPACWRVRRSLDTYASRELDGARDAEVRRHLEDCHACHASAVERERLRALVRRAVRRTNAPESLRGRIQEMIRRDTE